jgi:hypothetical protein
LFDRLLPLWVWCSCEEVWTSGFKGMQFIEKEDMSK